MTEVVTGEAVVLDLAVARFPSRIAAQLIDIAAQAFVLAFIEIVIGVKAARHLNQASADALYVLALVLVTVAYPATFETLSRGKTLGKMALGLRVIGDDGGPERFRQALIRALSLSFIEIWLFPINLIGMPVGLITSMVSAKGKRLGDVFAGTFVIQERVPKRRDLAPTFTMIPPPLLEWSAHLEVSRLSDQLAATVSSYLRRYSDLRPAARAQIGVQLATTVAAHVSPPPPPGTPADAYLAAVLAVRRQREQARAQQRQAGPGQPGFGQPGFGQPGVAQPGVAQPGVAQPGFGNSDFGQSNFGQPGSEQPIFAPPNAAQGPAFPTETLPLPSDVPAYVPPTGATQVEADQITDPVPPPTPAATPAPAAPVLPPEDYGFVAPR